MVAKNFAWAAMDSRSFEERYFKHLFQRYPNTVSGIRNGWSLSSEQEAALINFSKSSEENRMGVYLHIVRYAPSRHPMKMNARAKVFEFIDGLRMDKNLNHSISYYEDGISQFLHENKKELGLFTKFCSAWAITPVLLDHTFKKRGKDEGEAGKSMGLDAP